MFHHVSEQLNVGQKSVQRSTELVRDLGNESCFRSICFFKFDANETGEKDAANVGKEDRICWGISE